jgi:hypothetical protein
MKFGMKFKTFQRSETCFLLFISKSTTSYLLTVQSTGKVEGTLHQFVVIPKQSTGCSFKPVGILLLLLLLLLFKAIEFSLGGSSPYTSTDKTNNNKYT